MLVLHETPAGYALFKLLDDGKIEKPDDLYKEFETAEKANQTIKLKAFQKFENTIDALSAATAIVEGKLDKSLKKFLSDEISEKEMKKESLVVADSKLGGAISKKLGIKIVSDSTVNELYRGIRSQISSLLTGIPQSDMNAMALGLSHSLSRYKLKFSPDKVDTMIVQAIALLDDLDKELNTYAMRAKEWYGWHFPEMAKIIVDNLAFARVVKAMGFRTNASKTDLSTILPEELEKELKDAAEISMGTEISDEDIMNITHLCEQVISITEYRTQLYEYLKNRMVAIAPNLTTLVGELVGARLIAHAGSLMNLAKHPASTVQILGAEKALFRALKTKHDTPKYGLIYHASLIGQAGPKMKGKIARMLATKAAISIRVDALGDKDTPEVGMENRAKVEARLRQLEGRFAAGAARTPNKTPKSQKKFELNNNVNTYNTKTDAVVPTTPSKSESDEVAVETPKTEKKEKKDKKEKKEKKEKKRKADSDDEDAKKEKKDKKKKKKSE
ncbi:Nop-domain-containing protein [Basidiobolus meristosporus CBS 931.73]|uniref:Nucleolar protein 58 n=1 Tax=Basidiobolus meristosporus CBS 931.73 TaxID=1314790 RepID=A0A1Y1Z6S9_9FUNG|nr:Nop-domain-containing protein [Basidiobolus meristosporus CBS 931.73]|eukprot:ORY05988.1 Nop-domain-containing protein [Basidiobolus meristosporus CBS 931.73]